MDRAIGLEKSRETDWTHGRENPEVWEKQELAYEKMHRTEGE
jgi:hypothetical protein